MEWKVRKTSVGNAIIIAAVTLVVGVLLGLGWNSLVAPLFGIGGVADSRWVVLDEVYNKLAETYDGDIDEAALVEGAKKGLTESLGDIYTVYMDANEAKDFEDDLHGNVGAGIGVEMGLRDGYVRVLRTLPDNPARKAGIWLAIYFIKLMARKFMSSLLMKSLKRYVVKKGLRWR